MQLKVMIFLILICLGFACHKDNVYVDPDPAVAILGKWEEVRYGNWPNLTDIKNPTEYIEFLQDSIMRTFEYASGTIYYEKYWIDSLLYEFVNLEDGTKLISPRFYYQFSDNYNTLRLDYAGIPAIFTTFILKRKK